MPELLTSDYARINEADRAHAVARVINESLFSDEKRGYRARQQAISDEVLQRSPAEQAEDVLAQKNAEEQFTLEVASDLEEIYNWSPDRCLAMSAAEFGALVRGFETLRQRRDKLENTCKAIADLLDHFYKTKLLSGYASENSDESDLAAAKQQVLGTLWGREVAYATLVTVEELYEELVFMKSMKTCDDMAETYDQEQEEERRIVYKEIELMQWLGYSHKQAKTEQRVADFMLNQYIFEHSDPTTKAHKDAKDSLLAHRDHYGTREAWGAYSAEIREWHAEHELPLDTPELVIWWVSDEELDAPSRAPIAAARVFIDEEVRDLPRLADKLDDFRERSLDASVAVRLIREGKADEVADNFHVFTGDIPQAALKLLDQKGVEYVLDKLHRLHSLDTTFMSALLTEWDKAWEAAIENGSYDNEYEWPLNLYCPTDKMGYVIAHLDSFSEGALSAEVPFELVRRMGGDRDHGGDSIDLVREIMKKVDRFEPFDHLALAKHYAKTVRVPHHASWHEMLAPVIDDLNLPDTLEAKRFIREVEDTMRRYGAGEYESSEL